MANEYEEYQQDVETLKRNKDFYIDEKDFFAKFMFTPEIDEKADFRHLDKNLAITRLSSKYNEPELARAILKALHVLSNPKYFYEVDDNVFIGFDEREVLVEKDGKKVLMIKKIPKFKSQKVKISYYPKTYHTLKAKFYSLTTTAMAREGHLLRGAGTRRLEKSESIEDRTKSKPSLFGFGGRNKNNSEGGF